jgi:hypothetical protein
VKNPPGLLAKAIGLALLVLAGVTGNNAHADNIVITYSAPTQRRVDTTALCANTTTCWYGTEDFANWSGGNFTSSFTTGTNSLGSGVSFTGVYTALPGTSGAQWFSQTQNEFGGTNASNYPELFGNGTGTPTGYQVSLSATGLPAGAGINYFGVWISALDPFNDLKIYDTADQLIAEFNSPDLIAALGNCFSGPNPYCGNPTTTFLGQDPGELFAFVNVFDLDGSIGSVVFTNSGNTGFESENDTVGYIDPIHPFGNGLNVPEPASLAILACGLLGLTAARQRRRR